MGSLKDLINVKEIPDKPGVYFFENANKEILYVGKAKNLKNRLSSYKDPKLNPRIKEMVANAETLSWVICPNEAHALILESQWIKREQPRYNIKLKNSQPYPLISFTKDTPQDPARVEISWRETPSTYGPYPGLRPDTIIDSLTNVYPVRTCTTKLYTKYSKLNKPCELGELGKCPAPCTSNKGAVQNSENINNIKNFLKGKNQQETLNILEEKMSTYALNEKFEKAAIVRDSLKTLNEFRKNTEKTIITGNSLFVTITNPVDSSYGFSVLKIRENSVVSVYRDTFNATNINNSEILQQIVSLIHADHGGVHFNNKIILNFLPHITGEEYKIIKNNLKSFGITLTKPGRGTVSLKKLGVSNAEYGLKIGKDALSRNIESLKIIKTELNLKRNPYRIEGYDVSHINGKHPYGSVVVFENARRVKYENRVVKIPDGLAGNDLESLLYVLEKRLTPDFLGYQTLPDLLLIDGGKEQFKVAANVLRKLGLVIPVVSLAKKMEELYISADSDPVILSRNSEGLKLLQAVRDASHDLALNKHRTTRDSTIE